MHLVHRVQPSRDLGTPRDLSTKQIVSHNLTQTFYAPDRASPASMHKSSAEMADSIYIPTARNTRMPSNEDRLNDN